MCVTVSQILFRVMPVRNTAYHSPWPFTKRRYAILFATFSLRSNSTSPMKVEVNNVIKMARLVQSAAIKLRPIQQLWYYAFTGTVPILGTNDFDYICTHVCEALSGKCFSLPVLNTGLHSCSLLIFVFPPRMKLLMINSSDLCACKQFKFKAQCCIRNFFKKDQG